MRMCYEGIKFIHLYHFFYFIFLHFECSKVKFDLHYSFIRSVKEINFLVSYISQHKLLENGTIKIFSASCIPIFISVLLLERVSDVLVTSPGELWLEVELQASIGFHF